MKFLYIATSGSENPTRAGLPFLMARTSDCTATWALRTSKPGTLVTPTAPVRLHRIRNIDEMKPTHTRSNDRESQSRIH